MAKHREGEAPGTANQQKQAEQTKAAEKAELEKLMDKLRRDGKMK